MAESIDKLFPAYNFPEITPIVKHALSFAYAFENSTFTIEHIVLGYMRFIEHPNYPGDDYYKLFPWYTDTSKYLYATALDKMSRSKTKKITFESDIFVLSSYYQRYGSKMNMETFYYLLMFLNINIFNSKHVVPYCSSDYKSYLTCANFGIFLYSPESHRYLDKINELKARCNSEREAWETFNSGLKKVCENANPNSDTPQKSETFKSKLDIELTTDITNLAYEGKLPEIVGRTAEINRIIDILAKVNKNNAMILGEAGVGKTAIVHGLAQKLLYDDVPTSLKGYHILELDVTSSIAGCMYRGTFEKNINQLIDDLYSCTEKIILYIDDIHSAITVGGNQNGDSLALGEMIKPLLSNSSIKIVGTSTYKGLKKIESDKSLLNSFDTIHVEETDFDETLQILNSIKAKFEENHKLQISNSALKSVIALSKRYIPERFMPDKAIDVLDSSCAIKRNSCVSESTTDLLPKDVITAISIITGIPVNKIQMSIDITNLEKHLSEAIIGQDQAISILSQTILRAQAGLVDERKPLGSFMFLGPTGVGKTELAKTLADTIFPGGRDNIIRLDMSEFMEKNAVSKFIGAAPGYIGYDEKGQLTEKIKHHPYSLVLLDEIEKAHPSIINIMLQVLDEGWLTDSHGEKINFRNTIIVMTSNVGSNVLYKNTVGFGEQTDSKSKDVMSELKKRFPAEFINRIDEIINFNPLTQKDILNITNQIISTEITSRLNSRNIRVTNISEDVIRKIAQLGYSPEYGARFLKRAIQTKLATPLATFILQHNEVSSISIELVNDEIAITSASTIPTPT